MIAMRYGTIPVVRKTGGLKNTVTDSAEQNGCGILFEEYSARALEEALERAISLYNNKEQFENTRENALEQDFSWDSSAKKYKELYETILTQV
jgi:starch synthase